MATVVIVGAGGSLAQAAAYRPARNSGHPPLDGDFFRRATTLAAGNSGIRTGVQSLKTAIAAAPEVYDPWERDAVTMEQFFADVYYAVASAATATTALPVFIETLRLYRRVLAQTTNWMAAASRLGAIDRLLRHEMDRSSEVVVVTFNHDLVLESVVARLPRVAGKWCLRSLYGDPDLRPLNWNVSGAHPNHRAGCVHSPPLTVLKLHGSMNWLTRTPTLTPAMGTLFPPQRTNRQVYVANQRNIILEPRTRASGRQGGRGWYLWPLVVPPIYDKQRITGMNLLQQVWDKAASAIASAERLVLFGYSIPEADVLAKQMLRTAARGNTSLQCVECINPDPTIVEKVDRLLSPDVIRLFADAGSFVRHS